MTSVFSLPTSSFRVCTYIVLLVGTGVLVCPGKQWATMLINKVLATLFMHFDLELVNPRVEPQEMCIFPVKWKDVQMKVMPRKLK